MFQLSLRRRGISDQAVLRAMEDVPREMFVEPADRADAYRDIALGIACGQTISQPFVVAYMTEQLQLQKITGCWRSAPAQVTRPPSCPAVPARS